MTLEDRVTRLEKQVRGYRVALGIVFVGIVGFVLAGATAKVPDVIQARKFVAAEFVAIDDTNRARMDISGNGFNPGISLLNKTGREVFGVHAAEHIGGYLSLASDGEATPEPQRFLSTTMNHGGLTVLLNHPTAGSEITTPLSLVSIGYNASYTVRPPETKNSLDGVFGVISLDRRNFDMKNNGQEVLYKEMGRQPEVAIFGNPEMGLQIVNLSGKGTVVVQAHKDVGLLTTFGPEGKPLVSVSGNDRGGSLNVYNKTGEQIGLMYADEYGNGLVGAYNRAGKGRTLTPGP